MSPQNQKALFLESKQGKFVVGERDVPKPGKGQLLVKIHSTSLNPVDYKIQETGAFVEKFPAILGVDVAGIVEDVGEGVQDFVKGDNVYAQFFTLNLTYHSTALIASRTESSPTIWPASSSTRLP